MKVRYSSRAIIINEFNEILLERFEFKNVKGDKVLWVTPGGGIYPYETSAEAIERELKEELGIIIKVEDDPIFKKDVIIEGKKGDFVSREIFYKIFMQSNTVFSFDNRTGNEKDTFRGLKWWSKQELQRIKDFAPPELLNHL